MAIGFWARPHKKTEEEEAEDRLNKDLESLRLAKESKDVNALVALFGSSNEDIRTEAAKALSLLSV